MALDNQISNWSIQIESNVDCFDDIKKFLIKNSKKQDVLAMHILSRCVFRLYYSAQKDLNESLLVEMIEYLWQFSTADTSKYYLQQMLHCIIKFQKAHYYRILPLIPLLKLQNTTVNQDTCDVCLSMNEQIIYMIYSETLKKTASLHVLYDNFLYLFTFQRSISRSSFLEFHSKLFDPAQQTLRLLLSISVENTNKLLGGVNKLFIKQATDLEDDAKLEDFQKNFYKYVIFLLKYERTYKLPKLTCRFVHAVRSGGLFSSCQSFSEILALFESFLQLRAIECNNKTFKDFAGAIQGFVSQGEVKRQQDFPANVLSIIGALFGEYLKHSTPIVDETTYCEFVHSTLELIQWIDRNWCAEIKADYPLCSKCNMTKEHLMNQLVAIAMEPCFALFKQKTITKDLMEQIVKLAKVKNKILLDLNCPSLSDLRTSWLEVMFYWAKHYHSKYQSDSQFIELNQLMMCNRKSYNLNNISDATMLRQFELIFNHKACDANSDEAFLVQTIDLYSIKILLDPSASDSAYLANVMNLQKKCKALETVKFVDLINRDTFNDFGFEGIVHRRSMQDLAELQMLTIFKYFPAKHDWMAEIFEDMWKERSDDYKANIQLAKVLNLFDDTSFQKLPLQRIHQLNAKLKLIKLQRGLTAAEKFQIAYTLGVINYQLYMHKCQQFKKITAKDEPISESNINKNELLSHLDRFNIEQESEFLAFLDEALTNFTDMAKLLETDETLSEQLYSLIKVMRTIENISSFYRLRSLDDKAIQAKLVVYVLAKCRKHENAQMSCLTMFAEYPNIYEVVVKDFKLPQTVKALLANEQDFTESQLSQQTAVSGVTIPVKSIVAIEFLMQLAIYNASVGGCDTAEQVLLRGRDIIKIIKNNQSDDRLVAILKTHLFHTMFILSVKYKMEWFEQSMDVFVILVTSMFKEIRDLSFNDYFTQVPLMLLKMIPEYVQYAIARKKTYITEPYLYMILKYSMRAGFGLRSAQLLVLSSLADLDCEKLDVCEIKLGYIDKILMFYSSANLAEKSSYILEEISNKNAIDLPAHVNDNVFVAVELMRRDSAALTADELEKAAINDNKQRLTSDTSDKHSRRMSKYIIEHSKTCDCGFCKYPQYQFLSYQTGCLYTRLLYMHGSYEISCLLHDKYFECWKNIEKMMQINQLTRATLAVAFNLFAVHTMMHHSHALIQLKRYSEAQEKIEIANLICCEELPSKDLALELEICCQHQAVEHLLEYGEKRNVENAFVPLPFEDFYEKTFGCKYQEPKTPSLKTPAWREYMVASTSKKNQYFKVSNLDDLLSDVTTAHTAKFCRKKALNLAENIFLDSSTESVTKKIHNKAIAKTPKPKEAKTPHRSGILEEKTPVGSVQKRIAKQNLEIHDGVKSSAVGPAKKLQFSEEIKIQKLTVSKTPLKEQFAPNSPSILSAVKTKRKLVKKPGGESSPKPVSKENVNYVPVSVVKKTTSRRVIADKSATKIETAIPKTPLTASKPMKDNSSAFSCKKTKDIPSTPSKTASEINISENYMALKTPLKEQFAPNSPSILSAVKTKRKLVKKPGGESSPKPVSKENVNYVPVSIMKKPTSRRVIAEKSATKNKTAILKTPLIAFEPMKDNSTASSCKTTTPPKPATETNLSDDEFVPGTPDMAPKTPNLRIRTARKLKIQENLKATPSPAAIEIISLLDDTIQETKQPMGRTTRITRRK